MDIEKLKQAIEIMGLLEGGQASESPNQSSNISVGSRYIIVCERGWVYAGTVSKDCGHAVIFDDVSNIRRWGTSEGLGQLAREGKQEGTKLDSVGSGVSIRAGAIDCMIPVSSGVSL